MILAIIRLKITEELIIGLLEIMFYLYFSVFGAIF